MSTENKAKHDKNRNKHDEKATKPSGQPKSSEVNPDKPTTTVGKMDK